MRFIARYKLPFFIDRHNQFPERPWLLKCYKNEYFIAIGALAFALFLSRTTKRPISFTI